MKKYIENADIFLNEFNEDFLYQDLPRWKDRLKLNNLSFEESFKKIYSERAEFRAVFAYRLRIFKSGEFLLIYNKYNKGVSHVGNLYLSCKDIGPGLYLEHAFSSIVLAQKIGDNFHMNQCVTIGSGKGGVPTIGSNVKVHTHSVVIGGVNIGDNVIIAAGSTVVNSIPKNCTVASPKAIILEDRNV